MKYQFKIGQYALENGAYSDFEIVEITIDGNEDFGKVLSSEITCIRDAANLDHVINSLEQIQSGEISEHSFGYDICLIDCKTSICDVFHNYKGGHFLGSVDLSHLYELLIDWRNFLLRNTKDKNE
jgi:hypothetical protein